MLTAWTSYPDTVARVLMCTETVDGRPCPNVAAPGDRRCAEVHYGGSHTHTSRRRANLARQHVGGGVIELKLGAPIDIDPGVALLEEVHRSAGHVAWLRHRLADLEESELVWARAVEVHEQRTGGPGGDYTIRREENRAVINVWWELYERERRHLANVAAAALRAGVEERRVRLAERSFDVLEAALVAALVDLGLDPNDSRVREIVGHRLREAVTVIDLSGSTQEIAAESSSLPSVFEPTRVAR